jgi:hypothetical protein
MVLASVETAKVGLLWRGEGEEREDNDWCAMETTIECSLLVVYKSVIV